MSKSSPYPVRSLTKDEMATCRKSPHDNAEVLRLVIGDEAWDAIPGDTPYSDLIAAGRRIMAATYGDVETEGN